MDPNAATYLDQRLRLVEAEVVWLRQAFQHATAAPTAAAGPDVATGVEQPGVAATQAPSPHPSEAMASVFGGARPPVRTPHSTGRSGFSLEAFVAGRGLQSVGLVLLLVGVAYFLKLAFDHGLIGPAGRVVLGVVASGALIVAGARIRAPRYAFFADGTIALGAGIGFLALWAADALFHLIAPAIALGSLACVTGVVAALSFARRSERLAVAAAIGGYLAPLLLDAGWLDDTTRFTYLFVLSAAFLALSRTAKFAILDAIAFVGVLLYAPSFRVPADASGEELTRSLAYFGGFFLEFVAALHFAADRDGALPASRIALVSGCVAAFIVALEIELAGHQHVLGGALFALAAVLIASVRAPRVSNAVREAYAWLGLGTLTLAVPALAAVRHVGDVWSIEAAVVIAIGARAARARIAFAGVGIYVLAALVTLVQPDAIFGIDEPFDLAGGAFAGPTSPFFNAHFFSLALLAGTAAVAAAALLRSRLQEREGLAAALQIATHLFALVALTTNTYDLVRGGGQAYGNYAERAQFAVSILWTFYGAALFGVGLARGSALLRWLGLALFAATVAKVFLVDTASLGPIFRVGSFIVLGLVLTGASALYQRAVPHSDDTK